MKIFSTVSTVAPEAVVQRCSVKNMFLEISQIHRKTPVPVSFLIKLQASGLRPAT